MVSGIDRDGVKVHRQYQVAGKKKKKEAILEPNFILEQWNTTW